ncbi:regulatory phage cox family protein [Aliamphritea ceti]|uniref:regulatory phage cox family protein n=1 Tax=Aliamphritea ceti TaxID=1524258 RepID=UPI0021C38C87|nr:regulatory phage cox family protein [Aliamphritea ceti]
MSATVTTLDTLKKVAVPIMRPCKFAELTGVSESTIRGMLDREELPAVQLGQTGKGKRPTRYINIVALYELCEKESASWTS